MSSDRIRRAFHKTGPSLGVIYGPPGVGKTTGALSFPKPLLIPVEMGVPRRKIDGKTRMEVDAFEQPKTYEEFLGMINEVGEDDSGDYLTLIIDSIDRLEPMVHDYVCRANNVDNIEDVGGGFGKGYTAAATEFLGLINLLNDLVRFKGMHVILIAHADVTNFTPPGMDSFNRWGIRLNKKSAAIVTDEADWVGFLNFSMAVKKTEAAFGKTEKTGVSGDTRILALEERAAATAKSQDGMPSSITIRPKQELYPLLEEYFQ